MTLPERIETERLTLRPLRVPDAGPITAYAGDKRVAEMLTSIPHPYPPGAAAAFIERVLAGRSAEHVWALDAAKIDGPEFIGIISIKCKPTADELSYWVGPPFWNTGYASEAAAAIAGAWRDTGRERLNALALASNEASAHVLVNAGFRETGMTEAFGVAAARMLPMRLFTLDIAATGATA
jgi:RimJ/RimL family protein N-acetyltransferase